MRNAVHIGGCLEVLKTLPDNSIHCCVTSPPYWGLRDYNVEEQIGLEPTPEDYTQKLVKVFREVKRVLRDDGVCWLNLGDSYSVGPSGRRDHGTGNPWSHLGHTQDSIPSGTEIPASANRKCPPGLKPKDLVGIPWRVAFALQADGWWLRSDIIWAKANVMPESITDRPTKSHEYIFLLTKRADYFYDHMAILEPLAEVSLNRYNYKFGGAKAEHLTEQEARGPGTRTHPIGERELHAGRNKRTVWHINPKPYPESHFAVFPEKIPETCIKAGTSEKGCCPACGAPWERILQRVAEREQSDVSNGIYPGNHAGGTRTRDPSGEGGNVLASVQREEVGWQPTCQCPEHEPIPCIVLDPFAGSGTTLATAKWLRRDYVGIELNPEYAKLIEKRLQSALDQEAQQQVFDYMATLPQDDGSALDQEAQQQVFDYMATLPEDDKP